MGNIFTRNYRRVKNYASENAGEIARGATVATVGVVATGLCGGNPACGVAAAAAVDGLAGGVVRRVTRRATEDALHAAERYFDDPAAAPRPPQLVTDLHGVPQAITSLGGPQSKFAASDEPDAGKTKRAALIGAAGVGALALWLRGR